MLEAKGNPFPFTVELQDSHGNFAADGHQFRRMSDASPRYIRDVQQTVDTTQVHERAEIGDVLDHALADLAPIQFGDDGLLLDFFLHFEHHAARYHDIAAALVQLDDLERKLFSNELVQVGRLFQSHLGTGQKGVHTEQVDHQAALDST